MARFERAVVDREATQQITEQRFGSGPSVALEWGFVLTAVAALLAVRLSPGADILYRQTSPTQERGSEGGGGGAPGEHAHTRFFRPPSLTLDLLIGPSVPVRHRLCPIAASIPDMYRKTSQASQKHLFSSILPLKPHQASSDLLGGAAECQE
eukprot:scaffold2314_cov267-Pinguiococcus_pyrenoidosus.AAC.7